MTTTIVLSEAGSLRVQPLRRRDRIVARLLAARLDARLAAGVAPESGRLPAARAAHLADLATRRRLALAWRDVVARADEPARLADSRVPVARHDVRAAAADIHALATVLGSAAPLAAQGIARARILLTDGAGPVYTEGRGLRTAVVGLVGELRETDLAPAPDR